MGRAPWLILGVVLLGVAISRMTGWQACTAAYGSPNLLARCYPELGLPVGLALGGILAILRGVVHR